MVRTGGSHPPNRGSIPLGAASLKSFIKKDFFSNQRKIVSADILTIYNHLVTFDEGGR